MADLSQTLNAPLSNPITGIASKEKEPLKMDDVYSKLGVSPVEKKIKEELKLTEPFRKDIETREKELAKSEGELKDIEIQSKLKEAEGKVAADVEYAKEMERKETRRQLKEAEQEYSKPFVPTQETAQDLAAMFSLINVIGFAFGGGGKQNAQVALSAMNGMLEGHRLGRDDVYKREKDTFEENLKVLKNKIDGLVREMEYAAEIAKTNHELGYNKAIESALKYESTFTKDLIVKQGIIKGGLESALDLKKSIDEVIKRQREHENAVELKNLEVKNRLGASGELYALHSRYGIPQEEVVRLGKEEIGPVAGSIESARVTSELADLLEKNPTAAGIAGQYLNKIDKYIPSRYDNSDALSMSTLIKNSIDGDTDVKGTEDDITQARIIAKKALDVINARAIAVSKRLLVAELKMQKEVLDPATMSGKSAPKVYKNLAAGDLEKNIRYGLSENTINNLKKQLNIPMEAKPTIEQTKKVVRTGVVQSGPNQGKTIVEYSDGTREYK